MRPGRFSTKLIFFIFQLMFDSINFQKTDVFWMRHDYMSISSVGMVLAVDVGLNDGIDSMSVFIIHHS